MALTMSARFSSLSLLLLCALTVARHVPEAACPASQTHRTLYLEHGAEGALQADPHCHLEIVTCPSCVLALNLSLGTSDSDLGLNGTRCLEQLAELWEAPHEPLIQRPGVCGNYVSRTRSVSVRAITDKLVLRYRAQRNRVLITGPPGFTGRLSSPYFPHPYQPDLNVEYTISCSSEACLVSLLFCDFQLAPNSIVELFDWNGARIDVVTGAHFRPSPVLTSGPRLVLRFYANGGDGAGYTATYAFHEIEEAGEPPPRLPHTDCGGYVDDLGGAITMMQMTRPGASAISQYDCLWIVRPSKNAAPRLHFSTHVYLKVVEFGGMGAGSRLSVHQGATSDGRLLELLKASDDNSTLQEEPPFNPREHVVPVAVGFYVRLRGFFGPNSRLAIAYAAFSYARGDAHCSAGGEHLCENRRCVARHLLCDGFDQCGDSTDEPASCYAAVSAKQRPEDKQASSWYTRPDQPNYLFPRVDPYADLRTATLIFVASSLGLVALVCALFVLLYRINSRGSGGGVGSPARRQHTQRGTSPRRDSQVSHIMAAIDTLLDEESAPDGESVSDEPPTYEPPPGYEECMSKAAAAAVKQRPRRPARRNRRKYRSHVGGRRRSVTPPPRYEAGFRGRRRWRSHGELLAGRAAVSRVCSMLTARCDTASDSELLNMHETPAAVCSCLPPCHCASDLKHNKFYTS